MDYFASVQSVDKSGYQKYVLFRRERPLFPKTSFSLLFTWMVQLLPVMLDLTRFLERIKVLSTVSYFIDIHWILLVQVAGIQMHR